MGTPGEGGGWRRDTSSLLAARRPGVWQKNAGGKRHDYRLGIPPGYDFYRRNKVAVYVIRCFGICTTLVSRGQCWEPFFSALGPQAHEYLSMYNTVQEHREGVNITTEKEGSIPSQQPPITQHIRSSQSPCEGRRFLHCLKEAELIHSFFFWLFRP